MKIFGNPLQGVFDIVNIVVGNSEKKKKQREADMKNPNSALFIREYSKAIARQRDLQIPIPDSILEVVQRADSYKAPPKTKIQPKVEVIKEEEEEDFIADFEAKQKQKPKPQPPKEEEAYSEYMFSEFKEEPRPTKSRTHRVQNVPKIERKIGEVAQLKADKDSVKAISDRWKVNEVIAGHRLDYFILGVGNKERNILKKQDKKDDIIFDIGQELRKKDYLPIESRENKQRDVIIIVDKFETTVIVEKYKPKAMHWENYTNLTKKGTLEFVLEVKGRPTLFNLAKMPHIFIAGTTGSGKSVLQNIIVSYCAYNDGADFTFISPKIDDNGGDLLKFEAIAPVLDSTGKTMDEFLQEALEAITAIRDLMKSNEAIHKENKNRGDKVTVRSHVLVIDEIFDLVQPAFRSTFPKRKAISLKILDVLDEIGRKGRSGGVHLLLATQNPTSDIVRDIKANAKMFALQVATTGANAVVGFNGKDIKATDLLGRGDGLVSFGSETVRFQSPM